MNNFNKIIPFSSKYTLDIKLVKYFALFSLFILLNGCSTFSINNESIVCEGSNKLPINSYSYSFTRKDKSFGILAGKPVDETKTVKKKELYYKSYDEIDDVTKNILSGAMFLEKIPNNNSLPYLHIDPQYTQDGDKCSWMLVSMYTAFLVKNGDPPALLGSQSQFDSKGNLIVTPKREPPSNTHRRNHETSEQFKSHPLGV